MITKPQTITVLREKELVTLVIHGVGALSLSRDSAHGIAREIMRVIGEIDAVSK